MGLNTPEVERNRERRRNEDILVGGVKIKIHDVKRLPLVT
jgi:hypothetical protein